MAGYYHMTSDAANKEAGPTPNVIRPPATVGAGGRRRILSSRRLRLGRGRLGGEDRVFGLDAVGDGQHLRLFDLTVALVEDGAVGDERALHDAVVVEGAPILRPASLLVFEPEDARRLRADVVARRVLLLVRQFELPRGRSPSGSPCR